MAKLALGTLVMASLFVVAACSSGQEDSDGLQVTEDMKTQLAATAAAFQVQSVAEMEDSGSPIDPKKPAPQFQLVDQSGSSFGSQDFAGKTTLLSFAYTHCPDVCPALFGQFATVQRELGERVGNDVELVIVTVDPARDTPQRLKERTDDMGGEWHFLTGSHPDVSVVWEDFGVRVEKQGAFVGHTGVTYLIDQQGLMTTRYPAYATAQHFLRGIDAATSGQQQ